MDSSWSGVAPARRFGNPTLTRHAWAQVFLKIRVASLLSLPWRIRAAAAGTAEKADVIDGHVDVALREIEVQVRGAVRYGTGEAVMVPVPMLGEAGARRPRPRADLGREPRPHDAPVVGVAGVHVGLQVADVGALRAVAQGVVDASTTATRWPSWTRQGWADGASMVNTAWPSQDTDAFWVCADHEPWPLNRPPLEIRFALLAFGLE